MSTTHEEIQIDIDALDEAAKKKDATGKEVVASEIVVEPAAAADPSADEGLEKLKKQLETERNLRIAADRRADQAAESEARARGDVQTTQLDLLTNAISNVKTANDALKSAYSAALTAQDFDKVADLQMEMSTNAAKLLALENGKANLEKQPKPTPRRKTDVVEEFASRCTPPSGAWVRAHPEYVTDGHKNRLMLAAHELALARNLEADTDEYFESIEKTLDLRKPAPNGNGNGEDPNHEDPNPMADAARPTAGRKPASAAPAAAPVARSGTGTGARPNTITLTPQEVEIAQMNGLTPEEYAKNKIALKKEGRLN